MSTIDLGEATATFRCETCDSPTTLKVGDDGRARCSGCGQDFGPYKAIKQRVRGEVADLMRDAFRKAFR